MGITEAQAKLRANFLGSSDTPVIMNLSPYSKTGSDIYWSKVAKATEELKGEWIETGNWLEGPLVEWAASELQVTVTTDPADLFHVAQTGLGAGLFAANHDSLIVGDRKSIEAKFANSEMARAYGDPGTDQIAQHVVVQVQHQMYVSDLEMVYVALAVPSAFRVERRLYLVPRDDELIDQIVGFGCQWWVDYVAAGKPPDAEAAPPLYVLKSIERAQGSTIALGQMHMDMADEDERLRLQIKSLTAQREAGRRDLIHALEDREIGNLPDGRQVTFKQRNTRWFNGKAFAGKHPGLSAEFTETRANRTLSILKGTSR